MTGAALTRALVVAVTILAAITVWLLWDAADLDTGEPTPAGTTAPRPIP